MERLSAPASGLAVPLPITQFQRLTTKPAEYVMPTLDVFRHVVNVSEVAV